LSVARFSFLRCWNHHDRPIVLSADLGPRDRYYDQSPSIVWCGSLTRSRTVRAVWNAGGGRRYSRVPASVDSYLGASLRALRCRQVPRRAFLFLHVVRPCEPCAADADPPRYACCALEEPETKTFRPLTSLVVLQAQLVGSKPSRRCRHTRLAARVPD
jgi:hypothetical protein